MNKFLKLKNELIDARYNGLTDHQVIDSLLLADVTPDKNDVPISDLQSYLMGNGLWGAIKDASADQAHPGQVVAEMVVDQVTSRFDEIDVFGSAAQQVLNGLVATGLMSGEQKTEIEQLGKPLISRAEQIGLGEITVQDVIDVRAAIESESK